MEEIQAVLLSDVHLNVSDRRATEAAVGKILERHPQSEVVFVGDLFEYASAGDVDPAGGLRRLLAANSLLRSALTKHVAGGGRVSIIPGNHDAALAAVPNLESAFGFPVRLIPWFARFGSVHVEHGHLFDRDNAPLHPLAAYSPKDEPLGVELMREVVVGLGAQEFAHAHQTTPAAALARAVRIFGWRLPVAMLRTGRSFSSICFNAAWGRWGRAAAARSEGRVILADYAVRWGVSEAGLRAVSEQAPVPTHARFRTVFARLYLDWVLACWIGSFGAAAWAVWGSSVGLAPAVAALYVVGRGLLREDSRYPPPLAALQRGALAIAQLTLASRVVFGHTHVEEDDGVYFNLGSFGYPTSGRRPYAVITASGGVMRRHLPE